jgi:hypothetical protein
MCSRTDRERGCWLTDGSSVTVSRRGLAEYAGRDADCTVVRLHGEHDHAVFYEGLDPITGRERRRRWHPAGTDRATAERLAARLAADDGGTVTDRGEAGDPERSPCHQHDQGDSHRMVASPEQRLRRPGGRPHARGDPKSIHVPGVDLVEHHADTERSFRNDSPPARWDDRARSERRRRPSRRCAELADELTVRVIRAIRGRERSRLLRRSIGPGSSPPPSRGSCVPCRPTGAASGRSRPPARPSGLRRARAARAG